MRSFKSLTRAAVLTATCVVLGYLFLPVPNLEMITAGIFFSGVLMGSPYGLVVGCVSEAIYSLTNPMGSPPIPLLITQVFAMGMTGLGGGIYSKRMLNLGFFSRYDWQRHLLLGCIGAVLTANYDLLTNLSFPLSAGFTAEQTRITLIMGIPLAIVHVSTNTLIFSLILPILLKRIKNWRIQ